MGPYIDNSLCVRGEIATCTWFYGGLWLSHNNSLESANNFIFNLVVNMTQPQVNKEVCYKPKQGLPIV